MCTSVTTSKSNFYQNMIDVREIVGLGVLMPALKSPFSILCDRDFGGRGREEHERRYTGSEKAEGVGTI